jgi:hypothetical protein
VTDTVVEGDMSAAGTTIPTVAAVSTSNNVKKRRNKSTAGSVGNSGPWSVDWLRNIQKGDIGLISSKNKRLRKVGKENGGSNERLSKKVIKQKAGGVLRHPVLTLKKVARLPSKDREEVMKVLRRSKIMKVLKQKIRDRRRQRERITRSLEAVSQSSQNESTSLASVNNDWSNWVKLNGSEVAKAADVQGIGKTIGVSFEGSYHNKFSVLSRQRNVELGPVLTPVGDEGFGVEGGV